MLACLAQSDIGGQRFDEAFVDHGDSPLHIVRPSLGEFRCREGASGEFRLLVERLVNSLGNELTVNRRKGEHLGEKCIAGGV
jgi:hypothetical protein